MKFHKNKYLVFALFAIFLAVISYYLNWIVMAKSFVILFIGITFAGAAQNYTIFASQADDVEAIREP